MPRKTSPWWLARIHEEIEDDPAADAAVIAKRLEQMEGQAGDDAPPSASTVYRRRREYLALPSDRRTPFKPLIWPDSFESGDLPWESASLLLPLLRDSLRGGWGRPRLAYCSFYWKIHQSRPDTPPFLLDHLARLLSGLELSGEQRLGLGLVTIEAVILFADWAEFNAQLADIASSGQASRAETREAVLAVIMPLFASSMDIFKAAKNKRREVLRREGLPENFIERVLASER